MFKNIVMTGMAGLICLPALYAQHVTGKNHFGIKGGFSAAMLIANDVESAGLKPGFHAGVFYEVALTDHLSLQPELLYSSKGGKLVYNGFIEGKVSYTLNYVELPLLVVYNFTPEVNLHAGGYVSSLRSAHAKNGDDAGAYDFEEEMKRSDFNKRDRGFVLGLGAQLGRSTVGLRYQLGLMNIGKPRDFSVGSSLFPDARTFTLNAYFGFKLL